MEEWHAMMLERMHELVAKGNVTAHQIHERTGIRLDCIQRAMHKYKKEHGGY